MVARWRYGAFRVVGLEFLGGTNRIDPAKLAPHLAQLEYLEFIKMPPATAKVTKKWRDGLPDRYAVLHCEAQKK